MRSVFLASLIALGASTAQAWPGFTWEDWQKKTGVEKPTLTSPQAGIAELLPLLQTGPESGAAITTTDGWEKKREGIRAVLQAMIGEPTPMHPPAPEAKELGREDLGSYERVHLSIASEADDRIPAYLLLPKQRKEARGPVMIVLHQTQAPGKQEACGMTGDPNMAFAKELAERGMICIAPDAIGFGERIRPGGQPYDNSMEFYARHPKWSFFGKMNWDVGRVIDYLETLDFVDKSRIGIIGHSHGAYGSIMSTVFDPRIALTVASCGYTTLRTDPRSDRWSHLTALLPRVGFYVGDIKQAPFDWHEIVACIAPRPYFNWATLNDDIFPETDNLADVYKQLEGVYGLYGTPGDFVGHLVPGKHRFPPDGREQAYTWIERQFSGGRP